MNPFKYFDAYTLRARLFPALLASAPVATLVAIAVPWDHFSFVHVGGSVAVIVILFAAADVVRRAGRARERELYQKWGVMPSTRMLRHTDNTFGAATKAAYLGFIARQIGSAVPTADEEHANPEGADSFYARCGTWLREHTRDTKKFNILFDENITYGFRRNLFGLKWPSLMIDLVLVMAAVGCLFFVRPSTEGEFVLKLAILISVAVIHAAYVGSVVTESSVREAAEVYARQLILCCEVLMGRSSSTPAIGGTTTSRKRRN